MQRIASRANALYRDLLRIGRSTRERRSAGRALIDGPHLISAWLDRRGPPAVVAVSASGLAKTEVKALLARCAASHQVLLEDRLFEQAAAVDTPVGIMALVDIPGPSPDEGSVADSLFVDGIQDPGNLGGMLRSAAAAGVGIVRLSPGCVDAWSPRALRAGMGAQFGLVIREGVDLEAACRTFAGTVVATTARDGESLFDTDLTGPIALLVGAEGRGLDPRLEAAARLRVTIPMAPGTESLNAAAAAAIVLFERVRQRRAGAIPGR